MNENILAPDLASKIEIAQDTELKMAGLYADIANHISDPTLQTLIYSLSGDAYGHFRILATIQTFTGTQSLHHTLAPKQQLHPTLHLNRNDTPLSQLSGKKSSFQVKTTSTNSEKGGEQDGNDLSSMY